MRRPPFLLHKLLKQQDYLNLLAFLFILRHGRLFHFFCNCTRLPDINRGRNRLQTVGVGFITPPLVP